MTYRYPKIDPNIDGKVARTELEYPTSDVTFSYLASINKAEYAYGTNIFAAILTVDSFTDKATATSVAANISNPCLARFVDASNHYYVRHDIPQTTADFRLHKVVAGTHTLLGYEAIDLTAHSSEEAISCSGSTIKAFRNDLTTPKVSVTDTDLVSGQYGLGGVPGNQYGFVQHVGGKLLTPLSRLLQAQRILEFDVVGTGKDDDPLKPNFAQLIDKHIEYGNIDKLSITWSAFDYKGEATMLITVFGDNPYQQGAILAQESYVKSKNLKVIKPPRDLLEAKQIYTSIKQERPDMIVGVHNLAYQCIGDEDLEVLAVADFYDGFVQGTYDIKDLHKVPEWELEKTIEMWIERLKKSKITTTEKDKHERKLKEVLKV